MRGAPAPRKLNRREVLYERGPALKRRKKGREAKETTSCLGAAAAWAGVW